MTAVRGILVSNFSFLEEKANRVIEAYKLGDRLEIATEAQLRMDIEDTVREMRREGFFAYAR